MSIHVFSIDKHSFQTLTLPIKKAYALIQDCNNNFEELVKLLRMKNQTLSISQKKSPGGAEVARTKTNESIPRYSSERHPLAEDRVTRIKRRKEKAA